MIHDDQAFDVKYGLQCVTDFFADSQAILRVEA
jgi:hypothetical protein